MPLRLNVLCALSSVIIAVGTYGCSDDATKIGRNTVEPSRPSGVPATAQWVGGADGGVFVQMKLASVGPPHEYQVRVFSAAGEVEASGLFRRDPPAVTKEELISASSLSGWDGEKLLLTPGGALVPIGTK